MFSREGEKYERSMQRKQREVMKQGQMKRTGNKNEKKDKKG
jgi:hypothetical protein